MNATRGTRAPILVTGMPRSGTTWFARLLASGPSTALTGREPMNPRGRQYALGGTLGGWTRLESPTSRQRRALRTSYRGWNPAVYSRYGHRQWAAPWPWTRIVVKDPFAMLSMPVVHDVTGTRPVLLYRHPGAALVSFRRMGWNPGLAELGPIVDHFLEKHGPTAGVSPLTDGLSEVAAMGWFWNALYGMALHDAERLGPSVLVVSHHDAARGGASFSRALYSTLGLPWHERVARQLDQQDGGQQVDPSALHNLGRAPAQVAQEWRSKLGQDERAQLDDITAEVQARLAEVSFAEASSSPDTEGRR